MSDCEFVPVEVGGILVATDRAVLVEVDGEEVWVPRSVIEGGDGLEESEETQEIDVAEWFAEKKGWL